MKQGTRIAGLCLLTTACVRHIYPNTHKIREYKSDAYAAPDAARTPGSLWSEGAHNLFEDARARRVGDILTVAIGEQADATRSAATNLNHDSIMNLGISSFGSALLTFAAEHPTLDLTKLISAATTNDFKGGGDTARGGAVNATLPVRIKETLPNGDFYVEGNKVLLVNDEESFLYMSGVVRPIDINPDNTVSSAVLADVELEYTGRGVITEADGPGWFTRLVNWFWPF